MTFFNDKKDGGGVKNGSMTVRLKKGLEDGGMVVEEFHRNLW